MSTTFSRAPKGLIAHDDRAYKQSATRPGPSGQARTEAGPPLDPTVPAPLIEIEIERPGQPLYARKPDGYFRRLFRTFWAKVLASLLVVLLTTSFDGWKVAKDVVVAICRVVVAVADSVGDTSGDRVSHFMDKFDQIMSGKDPRAEEEKARLIAKAQAEKDKLQAEIDEKLAAIRREARVEAARARAIAKRAEEALEKAEGAARNAGLLAGLSRIASGFASSMRPSQGVTTAPQVAVVPQPPQRVSYGPTRRQIQNREFEELLRLMGQQVQVQVQQYNEDAEWLRWAPFQGRR